MEVVQTYPLSYSSEVERAEFYRKTYAHVAGGVLLFILFEVIIFQNPTLVGYLLKMSTGFTYLVVLGLFILVTSVATGMVQKTRNKGTQYFAYGLYILAEAIIFVPLLYIAMSITQSMELINQAAIVTLTLFAGLTAIVFITKKDFSFLRSFLTIGGFIGLGLIIAGSLFGFNLGLWFSVGICALAGGMILFQTSNLIHKHTSEDYIVAAFGLFSSLMLLFWYILRIIIAIDGRD